MPGKRIIRINWLKIKYKMLCFKLYNNVFVLLVGIGFFSPKLRFDNFRSWERRRLVEFLKWALRLQEQWSLAKQWKKTSDNSRKSAPLRFCRKCVQPLQRLTRGSNSGHQHQVIYQSSYKRIKDRHAILHRLKPAYKFTIKYSYTLQFELCSMFTLDFATYWQNLIIFSCGSLLRQKIKFVLPFQYQAVWTFSLIFF